jgi:threonyl-tRNA synthetase
VSPEGKNERPVMLHRVIFGSLERFIGTLIEHYAGNFPLWLAPQQAVIIALKPEQEAFAREVEAALKAVSIRASIDNASETLNKKIRNAEIQKIPYVVVIGGREAAARTVSVRSKKEGDLGVMPVDKLIGRLAEEIEHKT